ncbi:MAG TPA: hypothetical protein VG317_04885 [Pseudonocardiaceae bacterium]|jgi:hypothetical protein|nr:hypothetical protein [Pseudonocardiaceae bacterium]
MYVATSSPQPARWRVAVDTPRELHRALFFRDALRLPTLPGAGHLTIPAPERSTEGSDRLALAWSHWWSSLLAHLRGGPVALAAHAGAPGLDVDPELDRLLADGEGEFKRWWTGAGRDQRGHKLELAHAARKATRAEADLLASRGQQVLLAVDVISLDGPFRHAVSRDHVVVSTAARAQADYPEWLARTVFPT